jgi:ADP-ribose pyrophosphatase YjhB (NUDIX family)
VPYCSACGVVLAHHPPVTCVACGAEHWRNAKPCAGALVVRDGRVLLLRRAIEPWRGTWDIPGGFCDGEEHPEETVRRELLEETGLEVRVTRLIGMWVDRYGEPPPGAPAEVTLNIYFEAEPTDDREPTLDPAEAQGHAWFGPDALPSDLSFPAHSAAVLEAWRTSLGSRVPGTVDAE